MLTSVPAIPALMEVPVIIRLTATLVIVPVATKEVAVKQVRFASNILKYAYSQILMSELCTIGTTNDFLPWFASCYWLVIHVYTL